MTHFNTESLTPEEVQKLKDLGTAFSDYTSLKDGDVVEWEIDPRSVKEVKDNFGNDKVQFKVYDPKVEKEFTWTATYAAAGMVSKLLGEGKYFLRLSRSGSTQKDTRYTVEEIKG